MMFSDPSAYPIYFRISYHGVSKRKHGNSNNIYILIKSAISSWFKNQVSSAVDSWLIQIMQ